MAKLLHPFLKIILGLILLVTSTGYITIKNDQIEKIIVNTFKDRIYSENNEFYLVSKTGSSFYTNVVASGIYETTNIGDCINSKLDIYNECSIVTKKYTQSKIEDYYKYYFVFDNKTIEIPKYE